MKDNYEIVYSDRAPIKTGDKIARVRLETKGRKGKGMSIVSNLDLDPAKLKEFAKELKNTLGSGGSVKNGIIEIQGNHITFIKAELKRHGIKFK